MIKHIVILAPKQWRMWLIFQLPALSLRSVGSCWHSISTLATLLPLCWHCIFSCLMLKQRGRRGRSQHILFSHYGMLGISGSFSFSLYLSNKAGKNFRYHLFLCAESVWMLTQSRNWGYSHSVSSSHLSLTLVSWNPPALGVLKLNFDGSAFPSALVVGYIIRDCNGLLLRDVGMRLHPCMVPFAELVGAWAFNWHAIFLLQAKQV